jgi:predicted DNA-binding antitoxin AbrB/MazE fold protein
MEYAVQAIYENGVLRPLEKLNLGEHQQVQLIIQPDVTNDRRQDGDPPDPLDGIRAATGIDDLAEHFEDYRFGRRKK